MNSSKNNWIKYSVVVSEEFVEPVVQMFSRFLYGNVIIEKEGDPEDGIINESIVSWYIPKNKNSEELEKNLNSGLSLFSGVFDLSDLKITEISSEIWEKQKFWGKVIFARSFEKFIEDIFYYSTKKEL